MKELWQGVQLAFVVVVLVASTAGVSIAIGTAIYFAFGGR